LEAKVKREVSMDYFLTYKLEGYQEIFERKELCG
jgi:hypothetical protein